MRREWIEIYNQKKIEFESEKSPSMRREWIEMLRMGSMESSKRVSLHAEGVD